MNSVQLDEHIWKTNLKVVCFGSVTSLVCMSAILPLLPEMIGSYGITSEKSVAKISGLAYAATFLASASTSPLWGKLSDKYGRRPMLIRASLALSIMTAVVAFATSPTQLILSRFILGLLGGYTSSSMALLAMQVPREKSGWALGTLSSYIMVGTVTGPLLGGVLSSYCGYKYTLVIFALLMFLGFVATVKYIKEELPDRTAETSGDTYQAEKLTSSGKFYVYRLCVLSTILAITINSIEPILSMIVEHLPSPLSATTTSGLVFSLGALGSIFSGSRLGKLADRIGNLPILSGCLIIAGILLVAQGLSLHTNIYLLSTLRFCTGIALGGLTPCIVNELKLSVPPSTIGIYTSINITFQLLGTVLGPLGGGVIAQYSYAAVFYATAAVAALGLAIIATLRITNSKNLRFLTPR